MSLCVERHVYFIVLFYLYLYVQIKKRVKKSKSLIDISKVKLIIKAVL